MIEDLSKTIKAQLYERVNSPLLASFALSWVTWNYRLIIVLFSSMSAPEKFKYIDENLYKTIWEIALRGTLYPLLTSLFLIFIYPIPAKYVYEYSRKRQRELKEIQQQIDDETPLTKEEARKLRKEMIKVSEEYEKELERRTTEIARLKDLLAKKESDLFDELIDSTNKDEKQKPESSQTNDNDLPPLSTNQLEILKMIADSSQALSEKDLISFSIDLGDSRTLAHYNLDELLRQKLIRMNLGTYSATPAGRAYVVEKIGNSSIPAPTISRTQPA